MEYYENFEYEFSKIYRRLLRLELLIKSKIINSVLPVYKTNTMQEFSKFLNNPKIYEKYKDDKGKNNFIAIRDNLSIVDVIKFKRIINMLHFRHLLHFVFTENSFRHSDIQKNFYAKIPDNFKELKESRDILIKLRNHIAHFNFDLYNHNKHCSHRILMLYEIHIGCSLGRFESIPNDLGYKPNMKILIEKIYELAPELFDKGTSLNDISSNKDRIIVDMYEDIAVLNGWEYLELKSQWDVIRTKYKFNKERIECGEVMSEDVDTYEQLSIFDELNWT